MTDPKKRRDSEMIERVARALYWNHVSPDRAGNITLSVAVAEWDDLAEDQQPRLPRLLCRIFWRDAARTAIEAMREPTEDIANILLDLENMDAGDVPITWGNLIDAALGNAGTTKTRGKSGE